MCIRDRGWRVPFFIGCLIVPALFVIRRSLEETPEFEARTHRPSLSQVLRSIGQNFGVVLAGTAMVVMTTVSFYLITAYTPTFGKNELQLSDLDSLLVTMCIGLSNFIWLPVMGAFSDRIGRKPLLLGASALALLTAYPALSWLVREPSFAGLLGVELWLSFLYSSYNGAMVVALTEVMPADVRTTGFSLAYSLATATFGGFTPAVCTWLIHTLDNRAAPGIWLSGAALLGCSPPWCCSAGAARRSPRPSWPTPEAFRRMPCVGSRRGCGGGVDVDQPELRQTA